MNYVLKVYITKYLELLYLLNIIVNVNSINKVVIVNISHCLIDNT